ncbi:unnamed protein product [Linum tenue]|uniref:Uncharacterized protein n=2 Tax=Linum tenue TaxID=586396 RepID=A0AAV0QUP5_9ROSI|nr:unnamed protein product [Linum tenue]
MGTPETSREPCPDRILDNIGGAFGMGAVGGSVFHFIKGVYNSPVGTRLTGGTQAVRMNAPRVRGSFAVWGGLFSAWVALTRATMLETRAKLMLRSGVFDVGDDLTKKAIFNRASICGENHHDTLAARETLSKLGRLIAKVQTTAGGNNNNASSPP